MMKRTLLIALLCLAGCTTSPSDSERAREVVLQYIGGDFGTAGPFLKHQKKELDVLAPKERAEAVALLERGAIAFLVYESRANGVPRVVVVQGGRVVGDYRAPAEQAAK